MSLLGTNLTLMLGPGIAPPGVAVPAPLPLAEALTGVSVTNSDAGRSGFQLTFEVGRSTPLDALDYMLAVNPMLRAFNRVVIMVTVGPVPEVLADGVITNIQLSPSNDPGASTMTVTGEDVSVMMDMQQLPFPWPAMSADTIVRAILVKPNYAQFGIQQVVMPAIFPNPPSPTERVSVQNMTDLAYIGFLAARQGYVFYVEPGLVPNTNYAYWGPPRVPPPYRLEPLQRAITFNAGPESNASTVSFSYDALGPTLVAGIIQDSRLNVTLPVITSPQGMRAPLASQPAIIFNQPNVRLSLLPVTPEQARRLVSTGANRRREPMEFPEARATLGLELAEALARAQATTDASTDNVVTATGELDALQFGGILRARSLVGLRGVGFSYGGTYYVKSVSHQIRKGEYKTRFTLTREGTGALPPLVRP